MSRGYSVDLVLLYGVSSSNQGPIGGSSVTLSGSGLGMSGYSGRGRAGGSAGEATEWVSDSGLRIKVAAGMQGSSLLGLTSGLRVGTLTSAMCYDDGEWSGVMGGNGGAVGGWSVSVSGGDFGSRRYSVGGRASVSEGQATAWASDSSLVLKAGAGVGGSMAATVSSGVCVGSASGLSSYDGATVSVVGRVNQGTSGGVSVSLIGRGLGTARYSPRGRSGGTWATVTAWTSDTVAVCKFGRGVEGSLSVWLSVGVVLGSLTGGSSLDGGMVSGLGFANQGTSGGGSVTVSGADLGGSRLSSVGRGGWTGTGATVWVSDSRVTCKLAGRAEGSLWLFLTLGSIIGGTRTSFFSFDSRFISNSAFQNTPSSLPGSFFVFGSDFGNINFVCDSSRVGSSSVQWTSWVSVSSLSCKFVSAFGHSLLVILSSANLQASLTSTFSMDRPAITASFLNDSPSAVSILELSGNNFGPFDVTLHTNSGSSCTEATSWLSFSSLLLRTSGGIGGSLPITISCLSVLGSRSLMLSFDVPTFSGTQISNQKMAGISTLTLAGRQLNQNQNSGNVAAGGTSIERSMWVSDSSILCLLSERFGQSIAISGTVGNCVGSATALLSFDLGISSSVLRSNSGSSTIGSASIFGVNFGVNMYCSGIRILRTDAQSTSWVSDTIILVLVG